MGIITVCSNLMLLFLPTRTETFVAGLEANCDKTTQMVICLLPNNRKDRYDAIKKLCCVEQPIPSQCVLTKTLMKQQVGKRFER